jgi:hypothetical protein
MPARDETGPFGKGTRTGRGFGNCAGAAVLPVVAGIAAGLCYGFGRKRGNGAGRGRGFGWGQNQEQGSRE